MIHSSKISIERTLEFSRLPNIFSSSIDLVSDSSIAFSSHRSNPLVDINPTSTFLSEKDPSRMIPNSKNSTPSRDLRLVVHGSKGGEVHHLIKYVVKEVQYLRGTHVDLEVLTQKKPVISSSSSIWLVPLLLLPGKHAQIDIPAIFRRLSCQGISTQLIPFLGSWTHWILILKYFVNLKSKIENPILLHHPINTGDVGINYIKNLNKILKIPIIPWTEWHQFLDNSHLKYTPIPLALAPNQNTRYLKGCNSASSLLEIDFFLFGLIHILSRLP